MRNASLGSFVVPTPKSEHTQSKMAMTSVGDIVMWTAIVYVM